MYSPFDRDKTAKWIRQEDGKSYLDYLREQVKRELSQLRNAGDLLAIGRSQGRLEILEQLVKLREEQ